MEYLDITSKEMPHSVEAEQTVLGALLIDQDLLSVVMEHLKAESFYVAKHRELFNIIVRQFSMNVDSDIITVVEESVREKIFENAQIGKTYLASIMEGVPSLANIESYCKIIAEKFYLRSLIEAAKEIIRNCTESNEEASTLLDSAEQMIYDIRQGKEINGLTKISEVLINTYDYLQQMAGADREQYQVARTGYSGIDNVIGGLNKSDLLILAARPGMGKTAFALNLVTNVARHNKDKEVVFFSLEMSKEQLAIRMLSAESLVANDHLRKASDLSEDWSKLAQGSERLSEMNIYLDDSAGMTVTQMKAKLRRLKNVGLVVIDYLQLMNSGRRIDNRVQEISDITRQLKLMAKELDVPVITLSQLSRAVESRTYKRPMLSDLRESGSIEQDADIVMFLYREGYYNRDKIEDVNLAECIVAKNRHGETGTINLRWNGSYQLFLSEDKRLSPDKV